MRLAAFPTQCFSHETSPEYFVEHRKADRVRGTDAIGSLARGWGRLTIVYRLGLRPWRPPLGYQFASPHDRSQMGMTRGLGLRARITPTDNYGLQEEAGG